MVSVYLYEEEESTMSTPLLSLISPMMRTILSMLLGVEKTGISMRDVGCVI